MGKLTNKTRSYSSCFWFLHCSFKCFWFSFTFVPLQTGRNVFLSLLHVYYALSLLITPEGVKCLSASLAQPNPQTFANMNGFRDLVIWRFNNFSWNLAKCSLVNDEKNFDREIQSTTYYFSCRVHTKITNRLIETFPNVNCCYVIWDYWSYNLASKLDTR